MGQIKIFMNSRIIIKMGDITKLKVDAIVNAANSLGYMGGGVAGVIKKAAGQEPEEEAVRKGPTPVGKACFTTAGRLTFIGIIHAPTMEQPAMRISSENVYKATKAALELAEKQGLRSIAIPGMGTGVGGVPCNEAAEKMIQAIQEFKGKSLERVVLVDVDEEMVGEWRKQLQSNPKL